MVVIAYTYSMGDDAIFTDTAADIIDALDILYVPKNKGGRISFIKSYPDVAHHIFGEALYVLDTQGKGDRSQLNDLEQHAEQRRFNIVQITRALQKNANESMLIFYPAQFLYQSPLLNMIFTPQYAAQINAFFESGEQPNEERDYSAEAAFETDQPTLLQTENNEELFEMDQSLDDEKKHLSVSAVDIGKVLKDSTDIGKDILSDLQTVAEDYTPKVIKVLDGLRERVSRTAREKLKQADSLRRQAVKECPKPIPPQVVPPKPAVFKKHKNKNKKNEADKTWHNYVAQSQTAPIDETHDTTHTIKGAIDIEYDTNDYAYLYARDGYEGIAQDSNDKRSKPAMTQSVNLNVITDFTWGGSPSHHGQKTRTQQKIVNTGLQNTKGVGESFYGSS